ncbi:MAG: DUF2156 domain-containing protein, partial [Deltaproteobacteria bacterium]
MDIPSYPASRPLDLADRQRFDAAFAADPPDISEFTFTNLYAWRRAYGFRVCVSDGLIVLSSETGGKKSYFRPIGTGDIAGTVARLAKERIPFIRVPEKDRHIISQASGFRSSADRDNDDYVYSCKELVELKGKAFDGKRNFIKKFKRQYQFEYLRLDDRSIADCLDFQNLWCITRGCENEETLTEERDAVREMCHNFSLFGLFGGALRVEGKISAIAIGQRLNRDTMVMHALKALPDMPGSYQTMLNEFLTRDCDGFGFVNMEQDLGVEGL